MKYGAIHIQQSKTKSTKSTYTRVYVLVYVYVKYTEKVGKVTILILHLRRVVRLE